MLGVGFSVALGWGCSGRSEGGTAGTNQPPGSRNRAVSPFPGGLGRVGNQVRGIDAIPDYDDDAAELRARVEPQLPSPLPSSRAACVTMLDAARQFYIDTEGEESAAVATMNATHSDDLAACIEQTLPTSAACVAVLMAKNEGEFPWVLDQCRRAFAGDEDAD